MKTQKLVLTIAALMTFMLSAKATGTETSAKKSAFSLEKQFAEQLRGPQFARQNMYPQTVTVQFHINNDFSVVIEKASSDDTRLQQYVQKELSRKKFYIDRENVGKSYSIKLVFP